MNDKTDLNAIVAFEEKAPYRVIAIFLAAAIIAFNGVLRMFLTSSLSALPSLFLSAALLFGAILAHVYSHQYRFWVFVVACIVAGFGF